MSLYLATGALQRALRDYGIERFSIKLSDKEDAALLMEFIDEVQPVITQPGAPPAAYAGKLDGITVTWPNIERAAWKNPEELERIRRERELLREAERVADEARRKFLEEHGVSA